MGVPDDEYDCEAEIILDRLVEVHNVDDMATLVANVLRQQFGYGTTKKADGTKQTGVRCTPSPTWTRCTAPTSAAHWPPSCGLRLTTEQSKTAQ